MAGPEPALDPAVHRRLAAETFNHVWSLLEKRDRAAEDDAEMVHAAHASRYHWGKVGTPVNFARGEWQISRVYAVLGRAEPALHHAQRCLAYCQAHGLGDFDLAFAYEALARASAVAGRSADTARYLALAEQAGRKIRERDDRELFFGDLASVPRD